MQAVDGVDLTLRAGEIHALVGENGAGKSTLAAIAYGAVTPDAGTVERDGVIGLVHQHFALIDRLRVWENVLLGREPRRGWRIDEDAARERVRALAVRYGLAVDPDARVETLPVGVKQRVELLRELDREPSVLLLDEPTAALAPTEIASFFRVVETLAAAGTAVLVVTHKLAEVIAYSQRVTVMRAGRVVAHVATAETNAREIARAMVGGDVPPLAARERTVPAPLLAIGGLDVHSGEIVGVAGIEGYGQTELVDAIAGVRAVDPGATFDGRPLAPTDTPRERLEMGIRVVPQDRLREALVLDWTIAENAVLGTHRRVAHRDRERVAGALIEAYDVRPPAPGAIVGDLSGGNQQKLVVGRALMALPKLLVAYQPTRGVDVGAAALMHSRLIEARNAGIGIVLVSFELDEILTLSDTVYVMSAAGLSGPFRGRQIDRARIGALMAGDG